MPVTTLITEAAAAYDILTVAIFSNEKRWFAGEAWAPTVWDWKKKLNLTGKLANLVKAVLRGTVRFDTAARLSDYAAAVVVNDTELISSDGATSEVWSFNIDPMDFALYDGENIFALRGWKTVLPLFWRGCNYYITMYLDLYYPLGQKPSPPPPPETTDEEAKTWLDKLIDALPLILIGGVAIFVLPSLLRLLPRPKGEEG